MLHDGRAPSRFSRPPHHSDDNEFDPREREPVHQGRVWFVVSPARSQDLATLFGAKRRMFDDRPSVMRYRPSIADRDTITTCSGIEIAEPATLSLSDMAVDMTAHIPNALRHNAGIWWCRRQPARLVIHGCNFR